MEEAYKEGWIRAIGVSNFYPDRLVDLCSFVEVKPAINQVETHIFQQQTAAHEYMEKYGVQHESWGPFAEERKDFFTNPVLNEIGKKHDKSAAQVALRFLLQSDVVVIPKSTHKERMEENINVFDFALDASDMNAIRALDEKESLFFSHYDPAIAEMIDKVALTADFQKEVKPKGDKSIFLRLSRYAFVYRSFLLPKSRLQLNDRLNGICTGGHGNRGIWPYH